MISEYLDFGDLIISSADSIQKAIVTMNGSGQKIVLVVASERLVGVLTDGDLRKFLENSTDLSLPVSRIMNPNPLTLNVAEAKENADLVMKKKGIDAIPIVDVQNKILGLLVKSRNSLECIFVVMAGGRGKRLLPHTRHVPKPLVPIAGKPIIDFILEKASREGILRVVISINHLGELIRDHCGSGVRWGLDIDYITESTPLGTCGALSMLDNPNELPVVLTNSDVIFPESYASILDFHLTQKADLTIVGVPRTDIGKYGELVLENGRVTQVKEKPTRTYQILGGVYCFSPKVLKLLKRGVPIDMPEFINNIISGDFRVNLWTVTPDWWDIGQEADLLNAERWIRENNYGAE